MKFINHTLRVLATHALATHVLATHVLPCSVTHVLFVWVFQARDLCLHATVPDSVAGHCEEEECQGCGTGAQFVWPALYWRVHGPPATLQHSTGGKDYILVRLRQFIKDWR